MSQHHLQLKAWTADLTYTEMEAAEAKDGRVRLLITATVHPYLSKSQIQRWPEGVPKRCFWTIFILFKHFVNESVQYRPFENSGMGPKDPEFYFLTCTRPSSTFQLFVKGRQLKVHVFVPSLASQTLCRRAGWNSTPVTVTCIQTRFKSKRSLSPDNLPSFTDTTRQHFVPFRNCISQNRLPRLIEQHMIARRRRFQTLEAQSWSTVPRLEIRLWPGKDMFGTSVENLTAG